MELSLNNNNMLKQVLDFSERSSLSAHYVNVVHPTELFAKSANYESWQALVDSVNKGHDAIGLLNSVCSPSGKSVLGLQALSQAIRDCGFSTESNDFGQIIIRKKSNE